MSTKDQPKSDRFLRDNHQQADGIIARIIDFSVANQFLIILAAFTLLAAGIIAIQKIPLDAIPDLSDTQVIIRTDWPGQAPQVIEDQVTYPLSSQMLSLPKTKVVRGFSMFGTSFVYIVFEQGVDMYWARSRVLESLSQVRSNLPVGVDPGLGPDATGVGWIFQYALFDRSKQHDLSQLRSMQDWFIRFELSTVDGVAEVASVGGFVKEFQILVDPNKLRAFDISLPSVIDAVRTANQETGGRTLEMAETEYLIRSFGYVSGIEDLQQVALKNTNSGITVTLGDIARIVEGPAIRRGITELNGVGEAVGGIVVMRPGANALEVITALKERFELIEQGLPDGVEVKVIYDRSTLILGAVKYLKDKLLEESIVVALITFIFLLHVRSVLVAIITIPLGILAAFIIMAAQGISVNIMSLGGIAIAIGAMVDASIVMVENAHRKLSLSNSIHSKEDRKKILIAAAKEVGPGLFFSLLIITVSFLPVFALTGQSALLFTPLAYTKTYAMAVAALLSVTLIPVLMLFFIRGKIKPERDNPINRFFIALYKPCLNMALKWRKTTLVVSLLILVSSIFPIFKTGSEFMPPLYEGSLLYMPMTLPGVSVTKAREILQITNRQIMTMPEVQHAFAKAGRADTATDPAPLSMIETWIELKPRSQWRKGMTQKKLIAELDRRVRLPGMVNSWGYPIKTRLDMLTTGIRTPIGIKVSGSDLVTVDRLAKKIESIAASLQGTRSAIADRVVGGKYIEIKPRRRELARYGISLNRFQLIIQTALGGMQLDEAVVGRERYPIMLRYDRPYREHISQLDNILVPAPIANSGSGLRAHTHVPLADLAEISIAAGPAMIRSEDARLNGWVLVDIEDRDMGSYISDLKEKLKSITLPTGYALTVAGQYEQIEEANERLKIAIPATLLIIATLLYCHFGHWSRVALIMLCIPFGVSGGIWWLWFADYNVSVAVAVGFIALAGIAVETVVIMLMYIDQQMQDNWPLTFEHLLDNVRHGAATRLRPKLMTVSTIILGLIPIFLTQGPGADVMRRIALPMIGGMFTTLILTLILIPVLYVVMMQLKLKLPRVAIGQSSN